MSAPRKKRARRPTPKAACTSDLPTLNPPHGSVLARICDYAIGPWTPLDEYYSCVARAAVLRAALDEQAAGVKQVPLLIAQAKKLLPIAAERVRNRAQVGAFIVIRHYMHDSASRPRHRIDQGACHKTAKAFGPGITARDVHQLVKAFHVGSSRLVLEESYKDQLPQWGLRISAALAEASGLLTETFQLWHPLTDWLPAYRSDPL